MRTEQETRILEEIENLLKLGVRITTLGLCESKYNGGTSLENGVVYVRISEKDSITHILETLTEAGKLVLKRIEIDNYEKDHPNLMNAIRARIEMKRLDEM